MNQPSLDLSLFHWIGTQTSEADRLALLSLREAVCGISGTYRYLEVGSHLGGSLQPHVVDPRCVCIFSIDPRPLEQPDERWASNYTYEGNSTERMFEMLSKIPNADLAKIETFEQSSWELAPASIGSPVEFAFIDGEHTNAAVIRDFDAVRRFLSPVAVVAFHDCFVTLSALIGIRRTLRDQSCEHLFLYFPQSDVVVIAMGAGRQAEQLLKWGWKKGLPLFCWGRWKLMLKMRFPWIVSMVNRWRH